MHSGQHCKVAMLADARCRHLTVHCLSYKAAVTFQEAISALVVLLVLHAARGVHQQATRLHQTRCSIQQLVLRRHKQSAVASVSELGCSLSQPSMTHAVAGGRSEAHLQLVQLGNACS